MRAYSNSSQQRQQRLDSSHPSPADGSFVGGPVRVGCTLFDSPATLVVPLQHVASMAGWCILFYLACCLMWLESSEEQAGHSQSKHCYPRIVLCSCSSNVNLQSTQDSVQQKHMLHRVRKVCLAA